MTSKGLFFRAMKEDLRHKLWMIALSLLANLLLHPVLYLVSRDSFRDYLLRLAETGMEAEKQVENILAVCGQEMLALSGGTAVAGAVIVGLFGFRFLFHKNSIDLYHSLPVKRRTLFALCYSDGFLIWFVPALTGLLLGAGVLCSFFEAGMRLSAAVELVKAVCLCLLFSSLVFLLLYNLTLAAVMLSGNMLNTLVSMLILGAGAIVVWTMGDIFFIDYMKTFSGQSLGLEKAVYASPLASAPLMIYTLCGEWRNGWTEQGISQIIPMLSANLAVTVLLGAGAWIMYHRRDSEHAEQGIRSRAASAFLKAVAGLGAGMAGWMFFTLLAGGNALVWGCFGAILTGGLAFGVLDIVFHMEFKAFFAHKMQMAVTLSATLLFCFIFFFDFFGYDEFLPPKEEIAEIAVWDERFSNRNFDCDSESCPLERMRIADAEIFYPYLECVTDVQRRGGLDQMSDVRFQYIKTKVTLKDGSYYYRNYQVAEEDRDALLPLLASQEYLRCAYLIDRAAADEAERGHIVLSRGERRLGMEKAGPGTVRSIIEAYNLDLLENPEKCITGQGRLLAKVGIDTGDDIVMDVYDFMERTVDALEGAGFGDWVRVEDSGEVSALEFGLLYGSSSSGIAAPGSEERILMARLAYGVYGGEAREQLEERLEEIQRTKTVVEWNEGPGMEQYGEYSLEEYVGGWEEWTLSVSDRDEIAGLMEIVSYDVPSRTDNLYQKEFAAIGITDLAGKRHTGYIRMGELPEKYILRFGELKY